METGKRTQPGDLTHFARLTSDPTHHHIFHALRVLEAEHGDAPRLGESRRAHQDKVRLEQEAELAFQPSTIAAYLPPKGGRPARLINRVFGLFGPNGPLPLHFTEYARDRQRNHRDGAFVAFGNMLTHRMMSLFYRAWAAGQPAPSFDRNQNDPVERKVAALAGLHGAKLQQRDHMPDLAKRYFAGHLASGPKNAEGLVSILSAYFDAPVTLQQFIGSWLEVEPDDKWQLGRNVGLGFSTSIGSRVWTRASKFRIRVGPLTLDEYQRLLPGSGSLERMESIVRNYVGDALDWDINFVLKAEDVPRASLGATTALGHTSWVGARRDNADKDADDLFLTPPSIAKRNRPQLAA